MHDSQRRKVVFDGKHVLAASNTSIASVHNLSISTNGRGFWETQAMEMTLRLFCIVCALVSVSVLPMAKGVESPPDGVLSRLHDRGNVQ